MFNLPDEKLLSWFTFVSSADKTDPVPDMVVVPALETVVSPFKRTVKVLDDVELGLIVKSPSMLTGPGVKEYVVFEVIEGLIVKFL